MTDFSLVGAVAGTFRSRMLPVVCGAEYLGFKVADSDLNPASCTSLEISVFPNLKAVRSEAQPTQCNMSEQ